MRRTKTPQNVSQSRKRGLVLIGTVPAKTYLSGCLPNRRKDTAATEQLTTSAVHHGSASRPTSISSLASRPSRQVFSTACLQEPRIYHPRSTLIFGVRYCHINLLKYQL